MTPLESRAAWFVHRQAADAARAKGADFHCAQLIGFAATDTPPSEAVLCETCRKRLTFANC